MKGVVLAGGRGTRLRPVTKIVNKHVLPVYDTPMIFHSVKTLIDNGINEILLISTSEDIGRYIQLLESESEFEAEFTYRVQKEPKGIAHALRLAEDFVDEHVAVILGDNIVVQDLTDEFERFPNSDHSAEIFLKEVEDPSDYGIAEVEDGEVVNLIEKPSTITSNKAIIGLYLYSSDVFNIIANLEPSDRGEYEITDVNERFLESGDLKHTQIDKQWFDVGTPEGLFKASKFVRSQRRD